MCELRAKVNFQGATIARNRARIDQQRAELDQQRAELDQQRAELEELRGAFASLRNLVGLFYDAGFEDGQAANSRTANGQGLFQKEDRHLKVLRPLSAVAVVVFLSVNFLVPHKLVSQWGPGRAAAAATAPAPGHGSHPHSLKRTEGPRRRVRTVFLPPESEPDNAGAI